MSEFARKKGFFWISSEIHGGLTGFYDYGVNGTLLKRKFENLWRKYFLGLDESFYEIETAEIMPEKVFVASGHITNFVDPVAKCKKCGTYHRADHILEDFLKKSFEGLTAKELTKIIKDNNIKCPKCKGSLEDITTLMMMFPLSIGAENAVKGYLRPETAQGAYVNFSRHFNILRNRLPLGLAIIGKAYRNEISPRNLTTRMREFTQAELQIFFDPGKLNEHENWNEVKNYKLILFPAKEKKIVKITCENALKKMKIPKFYLWHLAKVQQFYLEKLKISEKSFRFRELSEDERAFYNKIHWDIELDVESLGGFKEMGGVHYRGDHDLSGHQKISKDSQEVFFDNKKILPHVLELSFGVDRNIYALIELSYKKEKDRVFLSLPFALAPIQISVFPLVKKDGLDKKAIEVYNNLKQCWDAFYDDSGSIGKRYYREDERGTPLAITIDHDTLKDNSVTIRDRNTTKQIRVKIKDLTNVIWKLLNEEIQFEKAGN